MPSLTEWVVILIVVLLLFGGKKIPELMRGLGQGVRSFKQGMRDIEDEIKRPADDAADKPADPAGQQPER